MGADDRVTRDELLALTRALYVTTRALERLSEILERAHPAPAKEAAVDWDVVEQNRKAREAMEEKMKADARAGIVR